jgi:hypothetical protein
MERDRRHKGRRASDHCSDLLDNPDVKTLKLAGHLLDLPADKRQAVEMYVKNLQKLMELMQSAR